MIFLVIVRRCFCEICLRPFDLECDDELPEKCPHCGSVNWEIGPEIRDAIYIRKGIAKSKRRLNPGSSSKARQDQGRRQWRQFKPKPVDEQQEPS